MKQAYAAKAFRLHPDRQGDASREERERAEWRMRELNASWAVLRDTAARKAYDAELAAARRSPPPRTARAAAPGTEDLPRPRPLTDDADEDDLVVPAFHVGVLRFAPIIVLLGVLLLILIVTAVVGAPSDDPDVVTTEVAPVGSCVVVAQAPPELQPGTPLVVPVDCEQPHTGEVVEKVPFPRPCPGGTTAVPVPVDNITFCLR